MNASNHLPGTLQHQKILQSIVSFYENDARILAVLVFGSLGRGNWDRYSDLDMDVVVEDGASLDVAGEVTRLCHALATADERLALLIPGDDDADVVFESLMEMSIRYHPLARTSPDIIDSMVLLSGRIERSIIEAAGMANREPDHEPLGRELDRCVRYVLETDSALQRGYIWHAVELLHYLRRQMMILFTYSHGGHRSYQFFQKEADGYLQARLGGTLPQGDLRSARFCLAQSMDILMDDLDKLTDGRVKLTPEHRALLASIRSRQEHLSGHAGPP
jgi:predicted nucleotidyltransferase